MKGFKVHRYVGNEFYDSTEYIVCVDRKVHVRYATPSIEGAGAFYARGLTPCNRHPDYKVPEQLVPYVERVLRGEPMDVVSAEMRTEHSEGKGFNLRRGPPTGC